MAAQLFEYTENHWTVHLIFLINYFLAMLVLHCCMGFSLVVERGDFCLV